LTVHSKATDSTFTSKKSDFGPKTLKLKMFWRELIKHTQISCPSNYRIWMTTTCGEVSANRNQTVLNQCS
jgi:hypothetical protein